MRKAVTKKPPYVGRSVVLAGVGYAAGVLGVSEGHLRFVLQGKRESKVLTDRVRKRFPALLGEVPQ
jgi:hypothetical protein